MSKVTIVLTSVSDTEDKVEQVALGISGVDGAAVGAMGIFDPQFELNFKALQEFPEEYQLNILEHLIHVLEGAKPKLKADAVAKPVDISKLN